MGVIGDDGVAPAFPRLLSYSDYKDAPTDELCEEPPLRFRGEGYTDHWVFRSFAFDVSQRALEFACFYFARFLLQVPFFGLFFFGFPARAHETQQIRLTTLERDFSCRLLLSTRLAHLSLSLMCNPSRSPPSFEVRPRRPMR